MKIHLSFTRLGKPSPTRFAKIIVTVNYIYTAANHDILVCLPDSQFSDDHVISCSWSASRVLRSNLLDPSINSSAGTTSTPCSGQVCFRWTPYVNFLLFVSRNKYQVKLLPSTYCRPLPLGNSLAECRHFWQHLAAHWVMGWITGWHVPLR